MLVSYFFESWCIVPVHFVFVLSIRITICLWCDAIFMLWVVFCQTFKDKGDLINFWIQRSEGYGWPNVLESRQKQRASISLVCCHMMSCYAVAWLL